MDTESQSVSEASLSAKIGSHFLSVKGLDRHDFERLLGLADYFTSLRTQHKPISMPGLSDGTGLSNVLSGVLSGKNVVLLFSEDSTRTRMSFELAAKQLGAFTVNLQITSSSMNKGESLFDTVETIEAMNVDAIVIRHPCAGVPHRISEWVKNTSVINAGDGCNEHPTQALKDVHTAHKHLGSLESARIAFVGDIRRSRVARSGIHAFKTMGADVTLVAPLPLLPSSVAGWPVTVTHDFDSLLGDIDICYMMRTQNERNTNTSMPSASELRAEYGLTSSRADRLPDHALIMHPGPLNRGAEIDGEVASRHNAVITTQVAIGIPMRMAVLFSLLGSES